MANMALITKEIYPYVRKELSKELNLEFKEQKLTIGAPKKEKKFDCVSSDNTVIASILTSSGYSKSGKLPVGKLNALYQTAYMINLTGAKRKIIVFTDKEFMDISTEKCKNFLYDFEFKYIPLSQELKELRDRITKEASNEQG